MPNTEETLFSAKEWLRYSRHTLPNGVGLEGQKRLKKAHVIIVGMGGLGSPASQYLAAAGVGQLTLIDHDTIDLSNLQRQTLYRTEDVGAHKAETAQQALSKLNPEITIQAITERLQPEHLDLFHQADFVLDCTDRFAVRYLINQLCHDSQTPWCYASVEGFQGQAAIFTPESACYRCLFPEAPQQAMNCADAGIAGPVPGFIGMVQALECIKFLARLPTALEGKLGVWDLYSLDAKFFTIPQDSECPTCQGKPLAVQPDATSETPSYMTWQAVQNWQGQVFDIRSEAEHHAFNLGGQHYPNSDLPALLKAVQDARSQGKKSLLYCQSGQRSEQALLWLLEQESSLAGHVEHLPGGIVRTLERSI